MTVNESSNVSLSCSATGNPTPKVYWKTEEILANISISVTPDRTHVLRLFEVSARDNRWITCVAENMAGKSEMRTRLIVEGTHANSETLTDIIRLARLLCAVRRSAANLDGTTHKEVPYYGGI